MIDAARQKAHSSTANCFRSLHTSAAIRWPLHGESPVWQWAWFGCFVLQSSESQCRSADQVLQAEAAERNAIRQKLESAYYEHRAALSQIIAANASYNAARDAYRDTRARFEFGLADYTDLADTISSLTRAMEQKAEAMTFANLSYAQLLRELVYVPRNPDDAVDLPITLPQT